MRTLRELMDEAGVLGYTDAEDIRKYVEKEREREKRKIRREKKGGWREREKRKIRREKREGRKERERKRKKSMN